MNNGFSMFIFFLIAAFFLIDLYVFKGVKLLTSNFTSTLLKQVIFIGYWLINLSVFAAIIMAAIHIDERQNPTYYPWFYYLFGVVVLLLIPKLVFVLFHGVEDIGYLFYKGYNKLININTGAPVSGNKISRSKFLSQIGIITAAIPFVSIAYGILKGRYDFRVVSKKLRFNNLPKPFEGLKIVHISDLHIGSFFKNYEAVDKGIKMVNDLEPDLIFFTGDMVNNYASELDGWLPVLKKLKAKKGKFSILGNHDYGDYVSWPSLTAKKKNLEDLKKHHEKLGFRLLLNEAECLRIEGEEICIAGVENWGRKPFVQYGNLRNALKNTSKYPFKMLLSHDPSHWDEEVLKKTDIDLTFSGHTHGMQFGVEIGSIKWSPVKMRYPRWGGLYREGSQYLYVNRGFGYIGFPGRVGMPPEITLIELGSTA